MWQVLCLANELFVPCLPINSLLLLLAELKATMYLPKVVAASHFLLIVVNSLAYSPAYLPGAYGCGYVCTVNADASSVPSSGGELFTWEGTVR
jgi:hypothetical protein